MKLNLVKHYMTLDPIILSPSSTVEEAASQMERVDSGIFPVGTPDRIEGMITDRDIVVRAVAKRKSPTGTKVSEIMTRNVFSVPEDATVEEAAILMRNNQVSRLVVKDHDGKVSGILSLGHFVRSAEPAAIAQVVSHALSKKKAA